MAEDSRNPIMPLGVLAAGLGQSRPRPRPGVVHVFVNRRGQTRTAGMEARFNVFEWIFGLSWDAYEVDTGEHRLQFSIELPCKDNVGKFISQVRLAWSVSDAAVVVHRQITDVCAEIEPWVEERMGHLTGDCGAFDRAEAERLINRELGSRPQEVGDVGLRICRFFARLQLDEQARAHVDRLTGIERETEADTREQTLYQQRMSRYKEFMAGGHHELLMLQLARRPQDVMAVAEMLRQEDADARDRLLSAFTSLIDADALEGQDVDPAFKAVMRRVVDDFQASFRPRSLNGEPLKALPEAAKDDADNELWKSDEDA